MIQTVNVTEDRFQVYVFHIVFCVKDILEYNLILGVSCPTNSILRRYNLKHSSPGLQQLKTWTQDETYQPRPLTMDDPGSR